MGGPGMDAGPGGGMPMGQMAGAPSFDAAGGGGRSKLPFIIGGIAAAVIIAVIAIFALSGDKKKEEGDGPIAIDASAAPSSATTPPPPDPAPTTPPSAEATAPAAEGEVMIKCSPACDEIKIDDKKIEDLKNPTKIAAGPHKVNLSKSGYQSQDVDITVEAGKKFEKEYKLTAEPKETASNPTPPTTKATSTGTGTSKTKTGPKCTGVGVFKRCK